MRAFPVVMEMPSFLSEKPAYYPALKQKDKLTLNLRSERIIFIDVNIL